MESSARSVLVLAAALVLVSCQPADAWYKQATGPSYYSVGRASGLLSGIRRSPHARRAESETETAETDTQPTSEQELHTLSQRLPPALRNMVNTHTHDSILIICQMFPDVPKTIKSYHRRKELIGIRSCPA